MEKTTKCYSRRLWFESVKSYQIGYYWWCWKIMQEKELRFLLPFVAKGMKNLQEGFLMFLFYV
jgi:hypothetical protein